MLVHPKKMFQIAEDSQFTYWRSPDDYVYRAPVNPASRCATGFICTVRQWEKIKSRVVKP